MVSAIYCRLIGSVSFSDHHQPLSSFFRVPLSLKYLIVLILFLSHCWEKRKEDFCLQHAMQSPLRAHQPRSDCRPYHQVLLPHTFASSRAGFGHQRWSNLPPPGEVLWIIVAPPQPRPPPPHQQRFGRMVAESAESSAAPGDVPARCVQQFLLQASVSEVAEAVLWKSPIHEHTALMSAAWRGSLAVVMMLLAAGADPRATDARGWRAADFASRLGKPGARGRIYHLLTQPPASAGHRPKSGRKAGAIAVTRIDQRQNVACVAAQHESNRGMQQPLALAAKSKNKPRDSSVNRNDSRHRNTEKRRASARQRGAAAPLPTATTTTAGPGRLQQENNGPLQRIPATPTPTTTPALTPTITRRAHQTVPLQRVLQPCCRRRQKTPRTDAFSAGEHEHCSSHNETPARRCQHRFQHLEQRRLHIDDLHHPHAHAHQHYGNPRFDNRFQLQRNCHRQKELLLEHHQRLQQQEAQVMAKVMTRLRSVQACAGMLRLKSNLPRRSKSCKQSRRRRWQVNSSIAK